MTDSLKANRESITIGSTTIDGFMLPDGSYRMSITQAAQSVGLKVQNASDFLRSKALKSLLGEGYTPQTSQVEIESEAQSRGQSRIIGLPLEVVVAYWHWQSFRGNRAALALCLALSTESLERRFDNVFRIIRSEAEYNDRLTQRIQQLETDLEQLGETYSEPDMLQEHINRLEEQIKQLGGEPWQLPGNDEK